MAQTDPRADAPHSRSTRWRASTFLAALAVATTLLTGCDSSATAGHGSGLAATATATATATPSGFVCANPPGSTLTYVYDDPDGNLMEVTGCSIPRLLLPASARAHPIAWSPGNRYLMVNTGSLNGGDASFSALDLQALKLLPTQYGFPSTCCPSPPHTGHIFIGWLDDTTFLGALVGLSLNNLTDGPFTIVKVNLQTQQETQVASVLWAKDIDLGDLKIRGDSAYLFYAGYQSKSEGGAYLHRISLADGADTKLVPLGYAGPGQCQVGPPCNWTAPWDISPDGVHVIYHSPGPTRGPSDTYQEPDTPLVYANVDGSSPSTPFGSKTAGYITTPVFSPSGRYVVQVTSTQTGIAPVTGGATFMNRPFATWRSDSTALVLLSEGDPSRDVVLYTLAGASTLSLQSGTTNYLWAH